MKWVFSHLLLIGFVGLSAQKHTLTIVCEDVLGDAVPFAHVFDGSSQAVTNQFGYANLLIESGTKEIHVSCFGYIDTSFSLNLIEDRKILLQLSLKNTVLKDVEVQAGRFHGVRAVTENEILKTTITANDMGSVPQIAGEPDILKPLQQSSGVQGGLPGDASVYVRGGDQYQNAMLLDGFPLMNLNHGLGYTSSIPPSSVSQLDFYKQGLPLEFGNAASSIIDVKTRNAGTNKVSGEISGGVGSLRGNIEAPVIKEKSGLLLSGRISTLGMAMEAMRWFDIKPENIFGYHDFLAKYHHRITPVDHIEVLGYYSVDGIRSSGIEVNTERKVSDFIIGVSWLRQLKRGDFQQKLHYSSYTFNEQQNFDSESVSQHFSYDDFGYQALFRRSTQRNGELKAGIGLNFNNYHILENVSVDSYSQGVLVPVIFGSYKLAFGERWSARVGVRSGAVFYEDYEEFFLSPRAVLQYQINSRFNIFGSWDQMVQAQHRFRNNSYGSALDLPLAPSAKLPIERTKQFALGLVFNNNALTASVQGFYRSITNAVDRDYNIPVLTYAEETNPERISLQQLSSSLLSVNGTSYGLETSLGYAKRFFKGHFNYTWSRALRNAERLNNGFVYPFEFNREHQFDIGGVIRFKKNSINKVTEIGLNYTYGTGNFTQFPVQYRNVPDVVASFGNNGLDNRFIGERNNVQLPPLQHLDVFFNFIEKKKRGTRIFSISVFNLLYSPLISSYRYQRETLVGLGPFPIIPSICYTYKFK